MSQAEELLKTLSDTPDEQSADYVSIGSDRFMVVPEHLKKLGVSPDHAVNAIKFVGPRYSENGTDLSKMSIYVNFMRADGYVDASPCTNISVDETDDTLLHYEWEISRNVTEVHGDIAALVCAKRVNSSGIEENHWNSEICNDFYVSEGMEVEETVISQYPDLVEYMLLRVATVENKTTQSYILKSVEQYLDKDPSVIIEQIEKVIADEPIQEYVEGYLDNYVDICTTTDRTLTNSVAGAYELVDIQGVSEQRQLTGKNLFNKNTVTDSFGINNSGVRYESETYSVSDFIEVSEGTVYTISAFKWIDFYDSDKNYLGVNYKYIDSTFTAPTKAKYAIVTILTETKDTVQLEIGETVTEYEPYCGGKPAPSPEYPQEIKSVGPEITVKTSNKNLISLIAQTKTISGVTFTVNDDGSITVNGTATANIFYDVGMSTIEPGSYIFSGCEGGSSSTYLLYLQSVSSGKGYIDIKDGTKTLTVPETIERKILISVYNGATINNVTFYPMISKEGGEFVKHEETSAAITLTEPLRSVGNYKDILCKKDGKWGVERHVAEKILDGSEDWYVSDSNETSSAFYIRLYDAVEEDIIIPCDKLLDSTMLPDGDRINKAPGSYLYVGVLNSHLNSLDVSGFTSWLSDNPVTFQYPLAEPTWEELGNEYQFTLDNLAVYDGITHVIIEGTDIQPVVTSTYGTSHWGARNIDNRRRIEMLEELTGLGDTTPRITVDISSGGTGGKTAEEARANLEVYSKAEVDKLLGDINAVLESLIG